MIDDTLFMPLPTPRPARALTEVEIIQNPALGAYLLWAFGRAYQGGDRDPPPVLLSFLVLPLLLHKPTCDIVASTRVGSGLALMASNLAGNGSDRQDLIAVHARALSLRSLTLESLSLGAATGLLSVDYPRARVRANTLGPGRKPPVLPERLKRLPRYAEKLGLWFFAYTPIQIATTLRVEF